MPFKAADAAHLAGLPVTAVIAWSDDGSVLYSRGETTPTDTAALDAAAASRDRALRDGLVVAGARHEAHRHEADDTGAAPATLVYGRAAPPPGGDPAAQPGAALWRAPGVGGAVCVWGAPGVSARVVPALRSFAREGFGVR